MSKSSEPGTAEIDRDQVKEFIKDFQQWKNKFRNEYLDESEEMDLYFVFREMERKANAYDEMQV